MSHQRAKARAEVIGKVNRMIEDSSKLSRAKKARFKKSLPDFIRRLCKRYGVKFDNVVKIAEWKLKKVKT